MGHGGTNPRVGPGTKVTRDPRKRPQQNTRREQVTYFRRHSVGDRAKAIYIYIYIYIILYIYIYVAVDVVIF